MASSQDQSSDAPDSSAPAEPQPQPQSEPQPESQPRPQPQFGEYAPEGWEWKPEAETSAAGATAAANGGPTPTTLPGVPHNLGAGSKLPPRGGASSAASAARQSSQRTKQQAPQAPQRPAAGAGTARAGAKPRNSADTIATIVLLVIGLIGAGQFSFAMFGIERTFALLSNAPGIDGFTSPAWLGTVGTALGLAVLAIYGVMAVYTIRRLRAGKLAFWVPLATGAVMTVVVLGTVFVAMLSSPGLASIITDPEQSAKLMEFIQSMGS